MQLQCHWIVAAALVCWNLFLFLWFASQLSDVRREVADVRLQSQRLLQHELRVRGGEATLLRVAASAGTTTPLVARPTAAPALLPVVVFCFDRAEYLKRALVDLFARRSMPHLHPIVVSQDGTDDAVARVVRSFNVSRHFQRTDRSLPPNLQFPSMPHYYHISLHYAFGLKRAFDAFPGAAGVIVLEEDISVSVDALAMFRAALPVLRADRTLMAISAFNDNGAARGLEPRAAQLHRTDFFGGLGWLLTRELWAELQPKWPIGFWDDWLRQPEQTRGRAFLRPELSRSHTFGEQGASGGQFYKQFLENNVFNENDFDWEAQDLSYLLKERYDAWFDAQLRAAQRLAAIPSDWRPHYNSAVALTYADEHSFAALANTLGIMNDAKSGVHRTAYKGVVMARLQGNVSVFVAPQKAI
jgi:alpha-1,3-mannosyl-glycoprotein beta-1,2-N-acetylglucosaminyltransferase